MPLREKQINALKQMLNLNKTLPQKTSLNEPEWKILVYDRCGQDIISPLLNVRELRELGVTLHLMLHSDRDPIPDVPVVYFLMPTEQNVSRISQDFRNGLYDNYYLNFISPISREKLENIATAALQGNCVSSISKVFDQYLNFITLENELFMLKHQDREAVSFYAINGAHKDTEIMSIMDSIVDSLFSVFVTFGTVPLIRSARGNAAEMIAERLTKKLRENIRDSRNSLFNSDSSFTLQRPLLVLVDRNMDLATPLHHTWNYQALTHDVLDYQLNRVSLEDKKSAMPSGGAKPRSSVRSIDLNPTDQFWQKQKGNPFPKVAEAVQTELEEYKKTEEEVKRLKSELGLEDDTNDEALGLLSDNTVRLTSTVNSLPALLERKRLIDVHTTIAHAILDKIKERKLDTYFETEEKLMSKSTIDSTMFDMIKNPECGSPDDKMRLFLIGFICGAVSDADITQYSAALQTAGCDLSPLNYIKNLKSLSNMALTASQYSGGGTKTESMLTKLMSHGSQFLMEGVKNLVVRKHNLPLTRIVDALMEGKSIQETDSYLYFDPKILRNADSSTSAPKMHNPFNEAIVFVVGGGNYIEYQNLLDYCNSKSKNGHGKNIIYGCTNLLNAEQFLNQLSMLGSEGP